MRLSYDDLMRPRTASQMHHFCLETMAEIDSVKSRLQKIICEEYYPLTRFCNHLFSHKTQYRFKLYEESRPYYDGLILLHDQFVANFQITGANVDEDTCVETLNYNNASSFLSPDYSFEEVHENIITAINKKIWRFKTAEEKIEDAPCWLLISFTISDIDCDEDLADHLHEMRQYPNIDEALHYFNRLFLISDNGTYVFELQTDCVSVHERLG